MKRTPFLVLVPATVAVVVAAVRWSIQGSGNVYTTWSKRFYLQDRVLGWRVEDDGPIWIGLEVIGAMVGVVVGLAIAAWVIRRVERRRGTPWRWARIAAWAVAVVPLGVPVVVFATGGVPDGAREMLPVGETAAAPTSGIGGGLDARFPGGAYRVDRGSSITARISAGKETFDARFAGDLQGAWHGSPGRIASPSSAEISVAAASVDTGIGLRSQHAREEYLYAEKFPRIGFTLGTLVAARQDRPDMIAFRAGGVLGVMGQDVPIEITGTLRGLAPAEVEALGLPPGLPTLVVQADTKVRISDTPLVADRDSFDADDIPIRVSLVLTHRTSSP